MSVSEHKNIYDTQKNKQLKYIVDDAFLNAVVYEKDGKFDCLWFYLTSRDAYDFAFEYLRDNGWWVLMVEEFENCNCLYPDEFYYACPCKKKELFLIECSYRNDPRLDVDDDH